MCTGPATLPVAARMAEWQTRRPQKPLSERACGFKSRSGHSDADTESQVTGLRKPLREAKNRPMITF